jgi:hypothetical protein
VRDRPGREVADWFTWRGVAAFVLKYRLARAPVSKYSLATPVNTCTERMDGLAGGTWHHKAVKACSLCRVLDIRNVRV